jgi:cell division protein FtsB
MAVDGRSALRALQVQACVLDNKVFRPADICLLPTNHWRPFEGLTFYCGGCPRSKGRASELSSDRTSLISSRPPGLVDVLDRILDKGLVIAGDIKVSLANVELLTLQIRLLVCSIDKAEQIGLNWWRYDTNLTTRAAAAEAENVELRERLATLEREIRQLNNTSARIEPAGRGTTKGSKSRAASKGAARKGKKRPPP